MEESTIPERVRCEKCENESAILIKILSTEKQEKRKREEFENWVYLENVLILVYKCQNCQSEFAKIKKGPLVSRPAKNKKVKGTI